MLHVLGWAVAKQTGWGLSLQPIALITTRINRIKNRFLRLAARVAAGTYRPRNPPKTSRKKPEPPFEPPPPNPLPTKPGWLLPLEKSALGYRCGIEALLRDPEMLALMARGPDAMRKVLRPMCRMLRMDLPPVLAKPRAAPRCRRPALTLELDLWGNPRLVWN